MVVLFKEFLFGKTKDVPREAPAPALIAVNNNVTQEFSDMVLHMLEKKPERRMQSLSDFLANLQTIRIFKRSPKAPQKNETPTSNESEAG